MLGDCVSESEFRFYPHRHKFVTFLRKRIEDMVRSHSGSSALETILLESGEDSLRETVQNIIESAE
jgi:hypothetical protein